MMTPSAINMTPVTSKDIPVTFLLHMIRAGSAEIQGSRSVEEKKDDMPLKRNSSAIKGAVRWLFSLLCSCINSFQTTKEAKSNEF